MLSRRWVAAASSRSESVRIRSAEARASLSRLSARSSASRTICRACASAASCSRWADAAGLLDPLQDRVELRLGGGLLLAELGGGALPALGQGGLEVSGGLRGVGALLLERRLTLLPQRGGVPLGRVALLIGGPPGVGEDPGAFGLGVATVLLGVLVGLVADSDGGLVGELAGLLGLGLGHVAHLPGLHLGQAEDLADPLAEVLERRLLGGADLRGRRGGLLQPGLGLGGALPAARRCTRSTSAGS